MTNLLLGILALLPLTGITAFFVFAEYSLVASRHSRIADMADKGHRGAQLVLRVMKDPDRYFAATQIGITVNSLLIGFLSEPGISSALVALLESLPLSISPAVTHVAGTATGLLVASFLQIVLSELVPRSITLSMAERIALGAVPVMNVVANLLRPFIWLLKTSSRLVIRLLRLLGVRAGDARERLHSTDELRLLLEASEEGGVIHEDEAELIDNAIVFGDVTVREIMVPRTEMACLEADAPLDEIVHTVSSQPFDRFPVYAGDLDHIVGMLHAKDLMRALYPIRHHIGARQLMRPNPFSVPDTQRADELLRQLRARREHMAIVVDEYGGTAGLVTLEDLLAIIVGEIGSEHGGAESAIQASDDGTSLVSGLTTIGEFNDAFDLALRDDNYDTVGGYVMGRLGRIPRVGDEIKLDPDGPKLRVESMDGLRVDRVRLTR